MDNFKKSEQHRDPFKVQIKNKDKITEIIFELSPYMWVELFVDIDITHININKKQNKTMINGPRNPRQTNRTDNGLCANCSSVMY